MNKNKNTTYQSFRVAAKAGLRGKFIVVVVDAYISPTNNLPFLLKKREKEHQTKFKPRRRKENKAWRRKP